MELFAESLPDPATATDAELRNTLVGFSDFFAGLFETHLVISGQAGVAVAGLARHCEQKFGDPGLANQLLGGIGEVESAAPSTALWDLGRMVRALPSLGSEFDAGVDGLLARLEEHPDAGPFLARFRDFLARYGSRGPNEWDTYSDTWGTRPEMALTLVDRMRTAADDHQPALRTEELGRQRRELEARLGARLRGPSRRLFHRLTRSSRVLSQGRERSKTTVIAAIHAIRIRALELDRRVTERSGGEPRDMWFVTVDELDDYLRDPRRFAGPIAERRRVRDFLSEREPPFFFHTEIPPPREWARRDRSTATVVAGARLEGLPGCPGVARGRARVVTDPSDPGSLGPGDVLIAPITDPSWTPLFVPAEAVVVDVGAVMSHAVIVSRELGIPCVVSVTGATRTIPDGALVEVDGSAGTVKILELP
ncbi:MAG TPA: phosphoenolpyruvate-utilizing protein [Acidimicrobiales bacterium]|nr:phosphoenolpyruvate-utilizing protein [Acidimicrobiales bacterium]